MITREACQDHPKVGALRRLLEETAVACEGEEATFWLLTADRQAMLATVNSGPDSSEIEKVSVPASASVVGMVAATGMSTSVGPDDEKVSIEVGNPVEHMAACPVYESGVLVGVVSVISTRADKPLGSSAIEQLEWKSWLMGVVIGQLVS